VEQLCWLLRRQAVTTRTRLKDGRAVDYRALASRWSKPSIGDDDGGLSDGDPESRSDDDGCSRKGGLGLSSNRWSELDEKLLLAYREDKSWERMVGKFPDRTLVAVRIHMVRPGGLVVH